MLAPTSAFARKHVTTSASQGHHFCPPARLGNSGARRARGCVIRLRSALSAWARRSVSRRAAATSPSSSSRRAGGWVRRRRRDRGDDETVSPLVLGRLRPRRASCAACAAAARTSASGSTEPTAAEAPPPPPRGHPRRRRGVLSRRRLPWCARADDAAEGPPPDGCDDEESCTPLKGASSTSGNPTATATTTPVRHLPALTKMAEQFDDEHAGTGTCTAQTPNASSIFFDSDANIIARACRSAVAPEDRSQGSLNSGTRAHEQKRRRTVQARLGRDGR